MQQNEEMQKAIFIITTQIMACDPLSSDSCSEPNISKERMETEGDVLP